MLRCEGCGVMHHPSCWVTNSGCATHETHRSVPIAQAYTTGERPAAAPAPHPGEGTRITPLPFVDDPARSPIPLRPAGQKPALDSPPDGPPVVGETVHQPERPVHSVPPLSTQPAPRRYVPPDHGSAGQALPRLYRRHPILKYWYVPFAGGLAVAVALGVIWIADQFAGGDDTTPAAIVSTAVTSPSPVATQPAQVSATPSVRPTGSPSPTAVTGPGKFRGGDVAVVTGTGDCLNVRVAAGRSNDAIVCLADGSEVTVTGGPETSGDLRWWKVKTAMGEGWAVEDYLVKKP